MTASRLDAEGMVGSGLAAPAPATPMRPSRGEDVDDGERERERPMLLSDVGVERRPMDKPSCSLPSPPLPDPRAAPDPGWTPDRMEEYDSMASELLDAQVRPLFGGGMGSFRFLLLLPFACATFFHRAAEDGTSVRPSSRSLAAGRLSCSRVVTRCSVVDGSEKKEQGSVVNAMAVCLPRHQPALAVTVTVTLHPLYSEGPQMPLSRSGIAGQ